MTTSLAKINPLSKATARPKAAQKRIWIDLDNSPHVPFFAPIIKELENRGHSILVTARNFAQVTQLAELMHLRYTTIGQHYGKNYLLKIAGVVIRAAQLAPVIRRAQPQLAISHGSRAQLLLSSVLKLPSVLISDYEFAVTFKVIRPRWLIVPELTRTSSWHVPDENVLFYPGIKEDVYVPSFVPDPTFLTNLRIPETSILVTLRPPATGAHYHNPESDWIFAAVVNWLVSKANVVTVVLPRTASQSHDITKRWGKHCVSGNLIIPSQAVDGLNLLWHSDLVISGGGTMNREAAALNLPVFSTFRGQIGAIDRYLVAQKKLVLIESVADIGTRIKLVKRERHIDALRNSSTLSTIVGHINTLVERECD